MSSHFKRRKITPLSLFSQIKKNGSSGKERNSMLEFIEEQSAKINNRYGQVLDTRHKKSSKQLHLSHDLAKIDENSSSQQRKSEQISQNKIRGLERSRFHSMQRVKRNQTSPKSPYMSQQRRRREEVTRMQTEPDKNRNLNNKSIASIVKNHIQKNKTKKGFKNEKEIRKIKLNASGEDKIFKHFHNLLQISNSLDEKKNPSELIEVIKCYVLEEQGDSAEIEGVYSSIEVVLLCRNILFLEKVLVIMIVDLIISHKLKIVLGNIRSALNALIGYYLMIYEDMRIQIEGFPNQSLVMLEKQTMQFLDKKSPGEFLNPNIANKSPNQYSFAFVQENLLAKIKHCFKFCKNLQSFYKFHSSHVQKYSANLNYFRLLEFYSLSLLSVDWSHCNIQFLQTCPSPYLHYESPKKYTLLLDLDETLIHYKVTTQFQGQFLIRPYLFQFLSEMSDYYEIGIFTCSVPQYADIIINHMKQVSFRLYRHHTIRLSSQYVKDLERVGRDLKTMILVDNLNKNFRLQKKNGIHVRSWYGDKKDNILKKLSKELKKLAQQQPEDLREATFQRSFL